VNSYAFDARPADYDAARVLTVGDLEMNRVALIGTLMAALLPSASFAEMNYSKVEVEFIDVELDGVANVDGDGFALSGAYELNDRLFLQGEWQDQSFDFGIDGEQLELGAGLRHEINSDLDFVGTLSYIDAEVEAAGFSVSDDGLGLGAGIRTRLNESFEFDAALKYVDLDDSGSDTGVELGGRWYFTKSMALSFGMDSTDNLDVLHVGFRAEF
jgi:hypothetical protein